MEKQIKILNDIREEVNTALNKQRIGSFRWNSPYAKFESSSGGYVLDPEEKSVIKQVFSKHGIRVSFYLSRNAAGVRIKVDDAGLLAKLDNAQ